MSVARCVNFEAAARAVRNTRIDMTHLSKMRASCSANSSTVLKPLNQQHLPATSSLCVKLPVPTLWNSQNFPVRQPLVNRQSPSHPTGSVLLSGSPPKWQQQPSSPKNAPIRGFSSSVSGELWRNAGSDAGQCLLGNGFRNHLTRSLTTFHQITPCGDAFRNLPSALLEGFDDEKHCVQQSTIPKAREQQEFSGLWPVVASHLSGANAIFVTDAESNGVKVRVLSNSAATTASIRELVVSKLVQSDSFQPDISIYAVSGVGGKDFIVTNNQRDSVLISTSGSLAPACAQQVVQHVGLSA